MFSLFVLTRSSNPESVNLLQFFITLKPMELSLRYGVDGYHTCLSRRKPGAGSSEFLKKLKIF
jgi:hypothetical protein